MPDIERPLSPRGAKDAPRIGKALRKCSLLPDCILCSTALRTRQTLDAVTEAVPLFSVEPQFLSSLYAASSEGIMEVLRTLSSSCSCVLMVGHNPGFEELLAQLTGQREMMPPGTLAWITLDIARWEEIENAAGRLERLLTPKRYKDEIK